MAPPPITEDFYAILSLPQTATPDHITRAYKRLALQLHPDRNSKPNATESFQLLQKAYETLRDIDQRRAYDALYPSLKRGGTWPHTTAAWAPPPHPHPTSSSREPRTDTLSDEAQIAALEREKRERGERWKAREKGFGDSVFELRRGIRRLDGEIRGLEGIVLAERAAEGRGKGWVAWVLGPLYGKGQEGEEERERRERGRQERRVEKDMKERWLEMRKGELRGEEERWRKAKGEVEAADLVDDVKISRLRERVRAREEKERLEREKAEAERQAKIRKQQREEWEKREREAAEARRKRQAEESEAEKKRCEEQAKEWQKIFGETERRYQRAHSNIPGSSTRQADASTCCHDGWWPKVQGRTACPKCSESWTYLLQCPGCSMKACPRCQAAVRPNLRHRTARTNRRAPPRESIPNPDFDSYDWYD